MRPSHTIAAIAIGWLAAVAVVGVLALAGRDAALERAFQTSQALALVLEENTSSAFESTSLTLGAIGDALHRTPGLEKNDPAFRDMLRQRLAELPYARALFVVGPDGFITHDTDYPSTPDVSLADRGYFKAHRDDPRLGLTISSPLLSRSGLGWFAAVSRPIGRAGVFQGVAVAAVGPAYFEALYRRLGLGTGDAISLFHRDRVLIAQHPGGEARVGKPTDSLVFSRYLERQPSGAYRTSTGTFSHDRVVAYRSVEGFPLVVAISLATEPFLAEWRRTALGAGVAMAVLTVLLSTLVVHFARQRRLRERMRQRRAQAEKLEALGQLTGGIAHDFGNLLNIVSTNLHMLATPGTDPSTKAQAIALAQRGVQRGSQLVDQLLTFARRQPLRLGPARLDALLAAAQPLLAQAAGSGIEVAVEAAPDLPACVVDATQLEVALVNLVVNARDAMGEQGKVIMRTFDCKEEDMGPDYVCLEVEDDGSGMSEDVRRRALEPFFTTKGEGGTGLGLAQVYGFMQQIGGSVVIDSTPGAGTAVRLYFPKASG